MSLYRTLLLSLCAASAAVATPALARPADQIRLAWNDRPRDQDRAYIATQRGQSMPLPMIERRVIPRMGGADYLGPELRGRNLRMKFMDRSGKVIWVDVDPRTGRILDKSDD
ncbi:hypothetical protein [Sphingomonas xanthus]|uniref:PepSY domain-containing protein n=1 Tax=Sphingomonas xanthus TaxID=2594473 RepID=A0A516ISP0_9SPHN|nr:hypothetical protein [Sphingomonas xanthus]QDP19913.1 hypothetical protein FMM02_08070 [Sphingomonas xanthus]